MLRIFNCQALFAGFIGVLGSSFLIRVNSRDSRALFGVRRTLPAILSLIGWCEFGRGLQAQPNNDNFANRISISAAIGSCLSADLTLHRSPRGGMRCHSAAKGRQGGWFCTFHPTCHLRLFHRPSESVPATGARYSSSHFPLHALRRGEASLDDLDLHHHMEWVTG